MAKTKRAAGTKATNKPLKENSEGTFDPEVSNDRPHPSDPTASDSDSDEIKAPWTGKLALEETDDEPNERDPVEQRNPKNKQNMKKSKVEKQVAKGRSLTKTRGESAVIHKTITGSKKSDDDVPLTHLLKKPTPGLKQTKKALQQPTKASSDTSSKTKTAKSAKRLSGSVANGRTHKTEQKSISKKLLKPQQDPNKDSLLTLVLQSLKENDERGGVSIQIIKKDIIEKKGGDWNRLKPHVKKALSKGIEEKRIVRPRTNDQRGSDMVGKFMLNKKFPDESSKSKPEAQQKDQLRKQSEVAASAKQLKGKSHTLEKSAPPAKRRRSKSGEVSATRSTVKGKTLKRNKSSDDITL